MTNFPLRAAIPACVVVLALLAACGGRQRDFGVIGYGWPVQCGEVRQQYRDRVAAAESHTPEGAPDGARHLSASVSAAAISETASVIVNDYQRRANRRLAELDLGHEGRELKLDLDAGDIRVVDINGAAAIDVAVTGSLEFSPARGESREVALSARFVIGLGLVGDNDGANVMVVPGASGFYDLAFDDDPPEADTDVGSSGASGPLDGIVQNGIRNVLGERVRTERLMRVEPMSLGETGVTLMPVDVRAIESTQELVVTFVTNLPVDVADEPGGLVGDRDVAMWVDEDVLSLLLRTLTESIGGRAVDRQGRPGGDILAFINSVETGDGTITALQEGYNLKFPCSWTITRMVASFEIEGDSLDVTVHDLSPVAASRQRWLVRWLMPKPEVIAGNMSEQLSENVAPPAIEMTGQTEIRIRLTDILPNPDGIVVRATIDASGDGDPSGDDDLSGEVDEDGNPIESGDDDLSGEVDESGDPIATDDDEESGEVDASGDDIRSDDDASGEVDESGEVITSDDD